MKNNLAWVVGGASSGKTFFAEQVAKNFKRVAYFGTARSQHPGDELALQIATLKQNRPAHWSQFDAPFGFEDIRTASLSCDCLVFDCLTMWIAWCLTEAHQKYSAEHMRPHVMRECDYLLEVLTSLSCPVVVVSAEVGSGVVPSQPSGRWFRDAVGRANLAGNLSAGFLVQVLMGNGILVRSHFASELAPALTRTSPELLARQLSGIF